MRHLLTRGRGRTLAAAALLAATAATSPAASAPPANDSIATPRVVGSVPYHAAQDTRQATSSADDGQCVGPNSVWYRYRPTTTRVVRMVTVGSDYSTRMAVFAGPRAARTLVACGGGAVKPRLVAGITYWIALSDGAEPDGSAGGKAVLRLYYPRPAFVRATLTGVEVSPSTGRLSIEGTLTCGTPSYAGISVTVSQRVGAAVARGHRSVDVAECTGVVRAWRLEIDSETPYGFQPGRAAVTLWASSTDLFTDSSQVQELIATVVESPSTAHRGG